MTEDIREKYSDTAGSRSKRGKPRMFAIDTGSPVSSLVLAWDGAVITRELSVGDSSTRLLPELDLMLAQAGARLERLGGLVGLRGPGSFTGLRVGLAVLLGLHQALRIRAAAPTTFEALARQAQRRARTTRTPIYAAVDALRQERFVQRFDGNTLEPLGEPEIRSEQEIARLEGGLVIGFDLTALRTLVEDSRDGRGARGEPPAILEAEPLAPDLLAIATGPDFIWDESELTRPLYLRPPAAAATSSSR